MKQPGEKYMENSDCSPSCEPAVQSREIDVLGKTLPVKAYICARDRQPYRMKKEPIRIQLTICPTMACNGRCRFCVAGGSHDDGQRLDLKRLEPILRRLKEQELIRGVSFSGGEPFLEPELLDEAISLVFEIFGDDIEISVNTNGSRLEQIHRIRQMSKLDAIHISRHHYDDTVSAGLFGAAFPAAARLREIVHTVDFRDLFVFNCLLIKGYIDSPEQAHRYMDFALETGVPKVAFITPMECNEFIRGRAVNFEQVLRREDPQLLFTRSFRDGGVCRCQDGVYCSPTGALEEFYGRTTKAVDVGYVRGLVYGADNHLRTGFSGEIIV